MKELMKLIIFSFLIITTFSCSTEPYLVCAEGMADYSLDFNIGAISYFVKSDSISISGVVMDSLTSEPLVGANIEIQFEDLKELPRTYTDINGNFVLGFKYDPNYIIMFSYVGYRSQSYNLKRFIQNYFDH